MTRASAKVVDVRPCRGGSTLRAFVAVQFASGLIVEGVGLHVAGSREWASPPARQWLRDGQPVLDQDGKPQWIPVVRFASHGVRSSWSRQVIAAVRAAHPEILADTPSPLSPTSGPFAANRKPLSTPANRAGRMPSIP